MLHRSADTWGTAVRLYGTAVFFCLLLCPAPAEAAWTRAKGQWFTAQTVTTYRTNHFVHDDGTRERQLTFRKHEWNGYAEYGWDDDTTLGANLFVHRLAHDRVVLDPVELYTEENYGLADSEFFLRRHLWAGKAFGLDVRFALQPLVKLPSLYLDSGTPRGGTDDFDTEIALQQGISFSLFDRHHYVMNSTAYRKRFGEWRDQTRLDTTLGLNLTDNLLLLTQLHITRREGSGRKTESVAAVNDYDLTKGQVSLVYRLTDGMHLQFGGFRHMKARNTADGEGLLFSIWKEF